MKGWGIAHSVDLVATGVSPQRDRSVRERAAVVEGAGVDRRAGGEVPLSVRLSGDLSLSWVNSSRLLCRLTG